MIKAKIKGVEETLQIGDRLLLVGNEKAEVKGSFDGKIVVRTDIGETKPIFQDEIIEILSRVVEKVALSLLDRLIAWIGKWKF
jgi:hypothetical protein